MTQIFTDISVPGLYTGLYKKKNPEMKFIDL